MGKHKELSGLIRKCLSPKSALSSRHWVLVRLRVRESCGPGRASDSACIFFQLGSEGSSADSSSKGPGMRTGMVWCQDLSQVSKLLAVNFLRCTQKKEEIFLTVSI